MAQRSSNSGCFVLVAVFGALAVGAVLVFALYFLKRDSVSVVPSTLSHPIVMENSAAGIAAGGEPRLVFSDHDQPTLMVPGPGERVTLELFAAYMMDSAATDLAKDSFRRAVDKAEVRWRMRLQQLSGQAGDLRGEFHVPWEIRHYSGSSRSSFRVGAVFDEASRASLLELRRGDWVTVEGRLNLASGQARIENAIVADAPVAEKP